MRGRRLTPATLDVVYYLSTWCTVWQSEGGVRAQVHLQHEGSNSGRRFWDEAATSYPFEAEATGGIRQQADSPAPDRGTRSGEPEYTFFKDTSCSCSTVYCIGHGALY